MNEAGNGRKWTAWVAIVPLAVLWLFCLALPLAALRMVYASVAAGEVFYGLCFLVLLPLTAWPAWRCWRSIRGYYTGREAFALTVSRGNVITALVLLGILGYLASLGVNYTGWAR